MLSPGHQSVGITLLTSRITRGSVYLCTYWHDDKETIQIHISLAAFCSAVHCLVCTAQACRSVVCAWRILKQDWTLRLTPHSLVSLNLLCCGRLHSSAPCCTSVHDGAVQCTPGITCLLCKQNRKQCLKGNTILVSSKEIIFLDKRETQDALGRWFYPSQKFRRFLKNIYFGFRWDTVVRR